MRRVTAAACMHIAFVLSTPKPAHAMVASSAAQSKYVIYFARVSTNVHLCIYSRVWCCHLEADDTKGLLVAFLIAAYCLAAAQRFSFPLD